MSEQHTVCQHGRPRIHCAPCEVDELFARQQTQIERLRAEREALRVLLARARDAIGWHGSGVSDPHRLYKCEFCYIEYEDDSDAVGLHAPTCLCTSIDAALAEGADPRCPETSPKLSPLGEAVRIARGDHGPPTEPVRFAEGAGEKQP